MDKSIIIWAWEAWTQLKNLLINRWEHFLWFLDDNSNNKDVIWRISDLKTIIENNKINRIFFAIASFENTELLTKISEIASRHNITLKVIPSLIDIVDWNVDFNKIRKVEIEDLLWRPVNKSSIKRIHSFIKWKNILVTWAWWTIWWELVKQLSYYWAKKIIWIDNSEIAIFNIANKLSNHDNLAFLIRDIKNKKSLNEIFQEEKIDIVFNAAAYKHVYLMELNSQEAITNNVIWLKNIIEVSIENNVKHFCQISTDKAVNPTNIMWATKRLWELILQYYSSKFKNININSVRFGNVLWSSWSVLTIFKEQIEKWENLTVTDENVTRFFMSIEEAVNLVITSVTLNDKWKIYVLDMWEAVKIIDLASQYIKLSWVKNIWIDIIWLKPWEKLYEELILDNSKDKKTNIEKLFITEDKWNINNLLEKIDDLSIINNKKKLIVEIKNIIPEFKHIER